MTTFQATFLRERNYLAVVITHFCVDMLNSSRNLLAALLAISIGLSNAQLGLALLLYNVGNALTQPLFGWLADRIGPRFLVVGGIGWMILFFSLTAVSPEWPALITLTLAGLGSGAFHPTGTMVASKISSKQRGRATAFFFMTGQMGLFFGPILSGILLEQFGRPGYLVLPALALTAFVSGWQWLINRPTEVHVEKSTAETRPSTPTAPSTAPIRHAALLGLIIMSYSSVGIAIMSFAPKLFTELGYEAGYVGWLTGLYMMGSAVGGVVGGALADRFYGKIVIVLSLLAAALPVYFYIPAQGGLRFGLLLLSGFFGGMPHSILILSVQSLLPNRRALASGLALGAMFFSGSVGSYVIGLIADDIGLALTLQGTAVLPLIAALASLLLPRRQT